MLKETILVFDKETCFNFTVFIFEQRKQWTIRHNTGEWECCKLVSQSSLFLFF